MASDAVETEHEQRAAALVEANQALQQEIKQRIAAERAQQAVLYQLVTIQEEERKRLARELHDHIGQQLTAIALDLRRLDRFIANPEAQTILKHLQSMMHTLVQDTHNLAFNLRPTVLDDLGLFMALRSYGEQWQARSGIRLEFHIHGELERRFNDDIETTIYRVTQEALTNIMKHAQATRVSVVIHHTARYVRLIIEDNGIGFDYDQVVQRNPRQCLGIQGMQERLVLLGGTVDIESTRKQGTTVYVQIPFDDGARH